VTRRTTPALLAPRRSARASAAAAGIALLLAASPALAQEGSPVVLASFAGRLPGELAALPERLTAAMADVLRDGHSKVTRAPLADLLAVAGCADASDECLQQARALLEAGRVVAGDVEPVGEGRVRITLRLIAPRRRPRRRTMVLEGSTAAALEVDFRAQAAAFWRDPDATGPASTSRPALPAPARTATRSAAPPPGRSGPASTSRPALPAPARTATRSAPPPGRSASAASPADPAPRVDLTAAPADEAEAGFSARRVSPLAWTMAGGGAGVAVIGGVLLMAAADRQGQIDDAPTDTPDDLAALVDLEESGSAFARWGSVLVVVGAVSAAAGVAFVVTQGREVERDGGALSLSPSLFPGGAGAVLTWRAGP
jgi:hypothetical protein